ncbi:hypothetical protein EDD22DRAFT_775821, partial [Suillus occidentalis]
LVKMVNNVFCRMPILLIDIVGLGKTIQITTLIAVLSFYWKFYSVPVKVYTVMKSKSN